MGQHLPLKAIGTTTTGTVGTTASAAVLAASNNNQRKFLVIHNPDAAKSLSYTLDGSTPVLNTFFTLGPLGTHTYNVFVPQGAVGVIGSSAGTPYTILSDQ